MIKRIASTAFGIIGMLYLTIGVLNLYFGPRLSTNEMLCRMSKGQAYMESGLVKILLWPFAIVALYQEPSCFDPSKPAQID